MLSTVRGPVIWFFIFVFEPRLYDGFCRRRSGVIFVYKLALFPSPSHGPEGGVPPLHVTLALSMEENRTSAATRAQVRYATHTR